MAEVHVIGQVEGASGYAENDLFCQWRVLAGPQWEAIEGDVKGQTQVDHPVDGEMAVWEHPVDIHYRSKGLQGWPKFVVQVWHQDPYGRSHIDDSNTAGYGLTHIPSGAGSYELEIPTWRPAGTLSEKVSEYFVGGAPQLMSEEFITSGADRFRLRTEATGVVHLKISILTKNFAKFGVGV